MDQNYFARRSMIIVSFSVISALSAQNLVPNPGFEVQDTCPAVSEIFLASPWNSPTVGTPDLFNSTCGTQNGLAHAGVGSSGIFCYSTFPDNREYLQVPLTTNLVAGQMYHVSFWVLRSNFKYAVSNFGAYFSNSAMSVNSTGVLPVTPQVVNPYGNVVTGPTWTQVSGNFTAAGGESHLILGNFSNDASTNLVTVDGTNANDVAYYRFDDVSVTATQVGIEELGAQPLTWGTSPSGDGVWISLGNVSNSMPTFSLNDLNGRTVPFTVARSAADRYDLMPIAPAAGIYLLRVQSELGSYVAKLMFQPN